MITALSEFVDFLYTRASTELARAPRGYTYEWVITIRPPSNSFLGPITTLTAHIKWEDKHKCTLNTMCNFDSVERGHRVGAEELGVVADYYIRKMNSKLTEAWSHGHTATQS